MVRQKSLVLVVAMLALTMLVGILPQRVSAQDSRCFSETGYCISGSIRLYWEQQGGLSVFGYPVTDLHEETIEGWTGSVQWFQRDRLEDHGSQGVMAGRLGARILELEGTPWSTFGQVSQAPAGCTFFAQTGHSLCEPFNIYWQRNGGLERFGYPITEPFEKTIGSWTGTVQYFERRRMEHHLENAGTSYEILLGLLGNEVLDKTGKSPGSSSCSNVLSELKSAYSRTEYAKDLGCAKEVYTDRTAAIQNMERGVMIWVLLTDTQGKIYAVQNWGQTKTYNDTWKEGMAETPDVSPPSGLYAPRRGFGKVWMDDPALRDAVGWALEKTERAETATIQNFDNGTMIWMKGSDTVYVLGPWSAKALSRKE